MSDSDRKSTTVSRRDGVVTVTMDRPAVKNALDDHMFIELVDTFREIADRVEDDRVVVLTGAGGEFCSGADLGAPPVIKDRNDLARMNRLHRLATALHDIPQPVIARIPGVAAGAGLNLALGCDLTIASSTARFSAIFARRGLSTDMGGAWLLPRLIGLHRAKEMALFGDVLSADEAQRLGLVNRVVAPEDLDATVDDWASRLAAGPPMAMERIKRLLNRSFETDFDAQLDNESTSQAVMFTTKDMAEAMGAFFEKRTPDFQGR
jgi:enoyl-CoA hydratase/carnithine racemase